jgi:DNA repair photolyase
LASNRVDPFAASNWRQVLPVLEMLQGCNIPVSYQTKGGRGIEEVLESSPPAVWYLSIAMWDDEKRKGIEPGAPSIQSRLELITTLRDKGHHVIVGVNPYEPDWFERGEEELLLQELADRGAWGIWCELLHLNKDQVSRIPQKGQEAIGLLTVYDALKRKHPDYKIRQLEDFRAKALDRGLEVHTIGQGHHSRFWEPFEECYPKLFPTNQGFINHCYEQGLSDYALVSFRDYANYMAPRLPGGTNRIGDYVRVSVKDMRTTRALMQSRYQSFENILKMFWAEPNARTNLTKWWCFAYASYGGKLIVDNDEGLPMLVFRRQPFKELVFALD